MTSKRQNKLRCQVFHPFRFPGIPLLCFELCAGTYHINSFALSNYPLSNNILTIRAEGSRAYPFIISFYFKKKMTVGGLPDSCCLTLEGVTIYFRSAPEPT